MDLLADENQHPLVIAQLRAAGHQVEWIKETSPGAADADILNRPDIGSLVLMTYDRDFGDLIFNHGFPTPRSIIYARLNRVTPNLVANHILSLIEAGIAAGHIITVTKDGNRIKPFPIGASHG